MDTPPALSTPSLTAPILPAHLTCTKDIASVFDDEIQYLGMKPAPLRSTPNPYQQVNGVVLHIQRDFNFWRKESDIPLRMVFHKSDTGVVHIGRRPATDSRASKEHDPKSNAMFRCAVVSRVHARIVFSEAGHVYLVDLKSHHGTHIRRPGEAIATMLKPETPTSVYDGDIITFGKSVGKGDDLVRPVVVKIELLYPSRPASDVFKPLLLPGSSFPFASSSLFGRSKSGSYGLRESESPSPSPQPEEAQKETSGRNEEADKPTTSALENLPILSQSSLNGSSNSSLGRALDAIKRFLPPARVSSPFLSHVWGDQSSDNSQGDVSTDHAESGSESSDSSYSVHSSASSSPQPSSPTPLQSLDLDDVTVQAPIASSSKPFIDFSAYDVFGDIDHLIYRARSFSPMDLATPSSPTLPASKPILHPVPRPIAFDPPIIGAWPISNHSSRPASRGNSPLPILPPIQRSFSPALSLSSDMALASDAEDEPDNKGKGREVIDVDEDCVPEIISVCPSPIKVADAPPPAVTGQLSNLNGLITEVHAKLGKLKSMRRDAKIEFDLYSNDTSTKLKDSDERISALEDQYSSLSDRIDLVIDEDISTLRYQLDQLQEQFKAPPPDKDDISSKAEIQREIQILNDLVAELKRSHETTLQEMAEQVSAAKAEHDLALANFTRWEADMQAQMKHCQESLDVASSLSRKRKREDDTDDDDDTPVSEGGEHQVEGISPGEGDMEVDGQDNVASPTESSSLSSVEDDPVGCENSTLVAGKDGVSVPSPKRARRLANAVARTATAVTVGAIVTWSALAFS